MNKYEYEDLIAIKDKKATIHEIAVKYGVSDKAILLALNRCGIYLNKKVILIHTPYGTKKCIGIREVANELKLSQWSIKQALKGKEIKVLKDLDIKLEVVE